MPWRRSSCACVPLFLWAVVFFDDDECVVLCLVCVPLFLEVVSAAIAGAARNTRTHHGDEGPDGSMNHGGHRTISVTSMMDDRTRTLFAAIDDQQEAMTRMLAGLVGIPTENPPGAAYEPCLDALAQAMRTVGLAPERVDIQATSVQLRLARRFARLSAIRVRHFISTDTTTSSRRFRAISSCLGSKATRCSDAAART